MTISLRKFLWTIHLNFSTYCKRCATFNLLNMLKNSDESRLFDESEDHPTHGHIPREKNSHRVVSEYRERYRTVQKLKCQSLNLIHNYPCLICQWFKQHQFGEFGEILQSHWIVLISHLSWAGTAPRRKIRNRGKRSHKIQ